MKFLATIQFVIGLTIAQSGTAVAFVVSARHLGALQFGTFVAAYGICTTAAGLTDFGTSQAVFRSTVLRAISHDDFLQQLRNKASLAAAVATFLLLLSIWPLHLEIGVSASAAFFLIAQTADLLCLMRLRGQKGNLFYAAFYGGERLLILAMVLVLTQAREVSVSGIFSAFTAGTLVSSLLSVELLRRDTRGTQNLRQDQHQPASKTAFGIYSAAIGLQSLDNAILAATGGAGAAAIYGAVARWTQPLGLMAMGVSQSFQPEIIGAANNHQAALSIRRAALYLIPLSFVLAAAITMAPLLVHLTLGDEYTQSATVLRVLALGVLPSSINQFLVSWLQGRFDEVAVAKVLVAAVLVQLVTLAVFARLGGAVAASMAFVLVQFALAIALSLRVLFHLK